MDYERLGQRLRAARERARLSQRGAAETLGVTSAALSQYETGKRRIDALYLERLARLYAVPLPYFFGDDSPVAAWEEALRLRADTLSPAGKTGIGRLIEDVRNLEELYRRTEAHLPGPQRRSPFAPLPDGPIGDDDVANWAERARSHYALGLAPIGSIRAFLEQQGYLVFAVPLGRASDDLSGLFFVHPGLGPVAVVNMDQAYTRQPFTLAHEFAHGLFHYDRPAILCRADARDPVELFADRFASALLVPTAALRRWVDEGGIDKVRSAKQIVHAARYFGVSYQAMRRRLIDTRLLAYRRREQTFDVQPLLLAQSLGYQVSPYELGIRPLPFTERLPSVFVELAREAVWQDRISLRRAAAMLGISDIELEEHLSDLRRALQPMPAAHGGVDDAAADPSA